MRWSGDALVFENYLTKKAVESNPLLSDMLGKLGSYQALQSVKTQFSGKDESGWDEILDDLIENDILVVENSEQDALEQRLDESWKWDLPARYFHFMTKNVAHIVESRTDEREYFEKLAATEPLPPHYKDCNGPLVSLPAPPRLSDQSFSEVLLKRRTQRWFKPSAITLVELSQLLFYTWGKTASVEEGAIDKRIMRTSASAGCRHPIEVYPIVLSVEGLESGIYHYSVRRHGLELLKQGQFDAEILHFCYNQEWVRHVSVYFIMTAILPRTMWRYRFSRAYRVVLMDAGHLGQTFQLVATSMGLDAFITAALNDAAIEDALSIDGISEIVVYSAAIGHVVEPVSTTMNFLAGG
jgi:SagB-type dehydrogenase family enzyme